jgi:long-chain acyl-CoA synthetase
VELRRWDDSIFLVSNDRRITYAAHETAVRRTADELSRLGVKRGDRVLMLAANSPEMIAAWWATTAIGAVLVLGNAWWSSDEVAHAIEVTTPKLALVDERCAKRLPQAVPRYPIETIADAFESQQQRVQAVDVEEDDPAVILFTSGTTGKPKGAVLSHRAVIANLQNLLVATSQLPDRIDPGSARAIHLLAVPVFHMSGMQTILLAALGGSRLVFRHGRFDAGRILDLIEQEQVTHFGAVPTMLSRILDYPRTAEADLTSVRAITTGGMPVSADLLARIRACFPNVSKGLGQVYGLSESGGVLTIASGDDYKLRPTTVGRPLPVVELQVNDPDDDGMGEILARSPTNMSGYWAHEDDTMIDSEGWLHTGDLGRIDEDGYLHILGRSKDVIIRAGENVAARSVEECLMQHPAVAETMVVGLPHDDLGEEVGAVVVLAANAAVDADALTQFAADRLAHFEVPTKWWIRRDQLPMTASGKAAKAEVIRQWLSGQQASSPDSTGG